jgi:hypothetical protein
MTDSFSSTKRILKLLGIPHSKGFLKNEIGSHPEPESLLAIADTLAKYRVETVAVRIGEDRLSQIPLPCIVQLTENGVPYFGALEAVADDRMTHSDLNGRIQHTPKKDFFAKWTGITLLLESNPESAEPGYQARKTEKNIFLILGILLVLLATALVLDAAFRYDWSSPLRLGALLIAILKLMGLTVSAVLLWAEVDKGNTAIKEFCGGGKNLDCDTVTNAFSLGGVLSLANLSFAYFLAGLILTFLSTSSGMHLLHYLAFCTLLIVPTSLYFQGIRLKSWCKLCLLVLLVLTLELIVFTMFFPLTDPPALWEISLFGLIFLGSILAWLGLKPYLSAAQELPKAKSKLARILSNQEIFDSLLSGARAIKNSPEGLGIFLHGKQAQYHILKVCNPYCGPCAKTHPVLEQLFDTGKIDLQIIFLSGGNEETRLDTVRHLMALAAKGDVTQTRQALDTWYGQEQKDYAAFAARYPLNGELKQQEQKIQSMRSWCELENISYTPTLFVNGYELPKAYTVDDLKYLLV